ncbi:MAG: hypothetical protein QOK39_1847 [Acidimicrobiaceae bacterium]|nr:hypothetical protein [Acidimicrobiaceae bacterium]
MGKRWRLWVSVLIGALAAAVLVGGGMVAITGTGRNAAPTVHAGVVVRATSLRGQTGAAPGHEPLGMAVASITSTTARTAATSTTTGSTSGGITVTTRLPRPRALTPKAATPAAGVPSVTTTTVPAPSNGTGVWTTESEGFTITLRIQPVDPVAGQNVKLTVTASSSTQWCCLIGATVATTTEPPFMPSNPCPLTFPSTTTQALDHVFRSPASYLVQVTVSGGKLCVGPPDLVNAHLQAAVVIGSTSVGGG